MKKINSEKNYKLGIICASDLIHGMRGGAAGFVSNVMNDFSARKVVIFGISTSKVKPWKHIPISERVEFVPICRLNFPSKIPMRLKVLLFYLFHRKKILKNDIDLLYIHMPECCLPFIFFKKIPFIFHQHGSANPVSLSKFKYARTNLFQSIFELIFKLIYKYADGVIAIDRFCYTNAVNSGAEKKTTLLRNAINVKQYRPNDVFRRDAKKKYGISKDQHVILFVGRIAKMKGVLRIINCVSHLKSKDIKFHIFFAGDGSYFSFVNNYVKEMNYHDSVTFLGSVDHDKLPFYYNMADVMVLPSDWEGIPMVILESLACGTPVVASRIGGIPEVVDHGINGYLIDDLSPENLTKMIIQALNLNKEREEIATSVQKFSTTKYMIRFDRIVERLLHPR